MNTEYSPGLIEYLYSCGMKRNVVNSWLNLNKDYSHLINTLNGEEVLVMIARYHENIVMVRTQAREHQRNSGIKK